MAAATMEDADLDYSLLFDTPERRPEKKMKPNTRFLRHLVRDVNTHNANVLAKETADAQRRLRELMRRHGKADGAEGARGDGGDHHNDKDVDRKRRRGASRSNAGSGSDSDDGRHRSSERRRQRRRHNDGEKTESRGDKEHDGRRSRHRHQHRHRDDNDNDNDNDGKHHRHSSSHQHRQRRRRSATPDRSRSPQNGGSSLSPSLKPGHSRYRSRSRSPRRSSHRHKNSSNHDRRSSRHSCSRSRSPHESCRDHETDRHSRKRTLDSAALSGPSAQEKGVPAASADEKANADTDSRAARRRTSAARHDVWDKNVLRRILRGSPLFAKRLEKPEAKGRARGQDEMQVDVEDVREESKKNSAGRGQAAVAATPKGGDVQGGGRHHKGQKDNHNDDYDNDDDDENDEDDDDDDMVGPLLPGDANAAVTVRGRGGLSARARLGAASMDRHFAPDYDPALDVDGTGRAAAGGADLRSAIAPTVEDARTELARDLEQRLQEGTAWRQKQQDSSVATLAKAMDPESSDKDQLKVREWDVGKTAGQEGPGRPEWAD